MSTHDGQNTENPVNPSGDTQPQRAVNILQEATGSQSRRKFLRAAVMSGVGVATVATTAGVAAACQSAVPSVFGQSAGTNQASGTDPCSLGFQDTALNGDCLSSFNVDQSGNNSPGQFYLFFTAKNLAPGTYTMSITVTPDGSTMMHSPFKYHPGQGHGVFLYKLAANTAQSGCPNFNGSLPGGQVADALTIQGVFPYTFSGSNADLQLAVHMDWDGTKITQDTPYTFTGTLTKDGQDKPICTTTTSVTAHYAPNGKPTPTPKPTATATATPTATPTPMPTATPTPHP